MRYYKLKQDRNLRNAISFEGFAGCPDNVFDKEIVKTFRRATTLFVKGTSESVYPDLVQSPLLLISEKLYKILRFYDSDTIYKVVVLTNIDLKRQEVYRLMVPETENYLSEKTVYLKNGIIDKIVLKKELNPHRRIFYVTEGITHHLIVTEDVLESILSRDSVGIKYEEVEVE